MRVLLLDNYDSFVFNLAQALQALGADVTVRRNDALSVAEVLALQCGAIVISPGPKAPRDAGISVPLVRAAAAHGVPLLGVCLGHQSIAEAFGGRTVPARRLVHGKTSRIRHDGRGVFEGVPDAFEAMRYHSLVAEEPLPESLEVCARSAAEPDDPGDELMAVRHRTLPIHGVQFHPESYRTPAGPAILSRFLALAAVR